MPQNLNRRLIAAPKDDFLKMIQTISGALQLENAPDSASPSTPQVVLPG